MVGRVYEVIIIRPILGHLMAFGLGIGGVFEDVILVTTGSVN